LASMNVATEATVGSATVAVRLGALVESTNRFALSGPSPRNASAAGDAFSALGEGAGCMDPAGACAPLAAAPLPNAETQSANVAVTAKKSRPDGNFNSYTLRNENRRTLGSHERLKPKLSGTTETRTRMLFRAANFRTTMVFTTAPGVCGPDCTLALRNVRVGRARPVSTPSGPRTRAGLARYRHAAPGKRHRREFTDFERIPAAVSKRPAPIKVCCVYRFHHHPMMFWYYPHAARHPAL